MKTILTTILVLFLTGYGFSQISKTLNCSAGDLNTLLTAQELLEITDLTLTGTIDARDIKTMRDSMDVLVNIDLSAAAIVEYNGDNGTGTDTHYPANFIPHYSFSKIVEEITFPNTLKEFGRYSVTSCSLLKSVVIPDGVKKIGPGAFNSCSGLLTLHIPGSVDTIAESAFNYCTALEEVTIEDGVKYLGDMSFYYSGPIKNLEFPASVNFVGEYAFNYSQIQSVSFKCDEVVVGPSAFYYSRDLKSIRFDTKKAVLRRQAFYYCDEVEELMLGQGIDSIYNHAFYYNKKIANELVVPSSCEFVGLNAFYYCQNIPGLKIEPGVKYIDSYAFAYCAGVKGAINLPESAFVGNGAFNNCTSLETIVVPSGLKGLSGFSFGFCNSVTDIWVDAVPPIYLDEKEGVFVGVDTPNVTLHIPYGSKAMYDTASTWKHFNIVEEAKTELSFENLTVSFNESDHYLNVTGELDWELGAHDDWIMLTDHSGSGNSGSELIISENKSSEMRIGTVTLNIVDAPQGNVIYEKVITVYQIGKVTVDQTISLKQGWNLVSLYVEGDNMSIQDIFPSNVTVVKNLDGFWSKSAPSLSSLMVAEGGEAYFVHSEKDQTITITGIPKGL